MGSDIARISFDPTRQYRSVVRQQGRVTLEADGNEASGIASEALRLETIDIIGPAGTPDDGYKVGLDPAGRVAVLPGTMYLGGWRLELDAPVELDNQPDWLDMPPSRGFEGTTLVALLVTEQSVGAVEDQPLLDVALGGPDSAARTRLMQHFLRLPSRGRTCDAAAKQVDGLLAEDGVTLDPATLQLVSSATLQVGFVPPVGPPDPCDPPAQGGYLGADNQMVRVTVIDFDPKLGTGTLLWGWNNASFLYRGTPSGPNALRLTPVPLDAEHAPQQNQAVEILLTQADLTHGNAIAALSGDVVVLTQAYDPDTDLMTLPASVTLPSTNQPLFVRLWQATVPFTSGTAVALDAVSGLSVTITMTALPTHIAGRPYWHFAVRPNQPQLVYPQRYLDGPQKPDGPRQWLCDLAVVQIGDGFKLLDDCRKHFVPLTALTTGTCCAVVMGQADVSAAGGLQAALEKLAGAGTPATLSLRPGIYVLPAPITLTQKHEWLTLEGCGDGVILQADPQQLEAFRGGMIVLQQATGVHLRHLLLDLPAVPLDLAATKVVSMFGIVMTGSSQVTIEACQLVFAPPEAALTLGVGVFPSPDCQALTIRGNRFTHTAKAAGRVTFYGIFMFAGDVATQFDDWEISGNLFTGLSFAVALQGSLGLLRCCDNRVRLCDGGFYFTSLNTALAKELTARTAVSQSFAPSGLASQFAIHQEAFATIAQQAHQTILAAGTPRRRRSSTAAVSAVTAVDTPAGAAAATASPSGGVDAILDLLQADTALAESGDAATRTVLHWRNNDVELAAAQRAQGTLPPNGLSLSIVGATQPCAVLIHGNRIETPSTDVPAATIAVFRGQAVITANLFTQLPGDKANAVPCVSAGVFGGNFEVIGNVIHPQATIVPARSPPPTTDWNFLNTIG